MGNRQREKTSSERTVGTEERRPTRVAVLVVTVVLGSLLVGAGALSAPATSTAATVASSTFAEDQPSFSSSSVTQTTTERVGNGAPAIVIENFSAPTHKRPGEDYTVTVRIRNNAQSSAVRGVQYRIGGNVVEYELIQIPPTSAKTVNFSITTDDTVLLPERTYEHGVRMDGARTEANITFVSSGGAMTEANTRTTENQTTTTEPAGENTTTETETETGLGPATETTRAQAATTTVPEPDSFEVSELTVSPLVQQGETMSVSAVVSNPTDRQLTQNVTLRLNGSIRGQEAITLGPNAQTQTTFTIGTNGLPPQDYLVGIFTRDFGEVTVVTVEGNSETTTQRTTEEPTQTRNTTATSDVARDDIRVHVGNQ